MTDNNHPITPPDELVEDWWEATQKEKPEKWVRHLATQAARWGYEQRAANNEAELQKARDEELEACCEWLDFNYPHVCITMLRAARRPKPPSLAEEALKQLSGIRTAFKAAWGGDLVDEPIRCALERLQELEGEQSPRS